MHQSYDPLSSWPAASIPQLNHTAEAVECSKPGHFSWLRPEPWTTIRRRQSAKRLSINDGLYFYCKRPGHFAKYCPFKPRTVSSTKPPTASTSFTQYQPQWKDKYNVEHENYEYEGETLIVKNRLKDHVEFWKNVLSPPELVLSTVKFGYVIPFFQDPIQFA